MRTRTQATKKTGVLPVDAPQARARTHAAYTKPRQRVEHTPPTLPQDPDALARLPQVLAFTGLSRTRFYALVKTQVMPKQVKVGTSSFWNVGAIREAVKRLQGEAA